MVNWAYSLAFGENQRLHSVTNVFQHQVIHVLEQWNLGIGETKLIVNENHTYIPQRRLKQMLSVDRSYSYVFIKKRNYY